MHNQCVPGLSSGEGGGCWGMLHAWCNVWFDIFLTGGTFYLDINIPDSYPFNPPKVGPGMEELGERIPIPIFISIVKWD